METYNRCITSLKTAKSDSEKLASLLVISKISSVLPLNNEHGEELLDAISANFIIRLMQSSDKDREMFLEVALNIIGLIAKINPSLLSREEILVQQVINQVVECGGSQSDKQIVPLVIEILCFVSGTIDGQKLLLRNSCFTSLKSCFLNNDLNSHVSVIFSNLIHSSKMNDNALELLLELSREFSKEKDITKFKYISLINQLCGILIDANYGNAKSYILQKDILNYVSSTCMDMLQSRLKSDVNQSIIILLSYMVDIFQSEWMFDHEYTNDARRFILLTLTTVSVELNWLFEGGFLGDEVADNKTKFTVSASNLMKNVIKFLCLDSFVTTDLSMDSEFIIKVFNCLKNAMTSVYLYVKSIDIDAMNSLDDPILLASLQVICIWATEETDNLRGELKSALPLIMKSASLDIEGSTKNNKNVVLLHGLTPCICQLLPDAEMRAILLKHHLLDLYEHYFSANIVQTPNEITLHNELVANIIHLFHQVAILEPEACSQSASIHRLHNALKDTCKNFIKPETDLTYHTKLEVVALTLSLVRLKDVDIDISWRHFVSASICLLYETLDVSLQSDLKEMWIVAGQNIAALTMRNEKLAVEMRTSPQLKELSMKTGAKYKDFQGVFSFLS